MTDPNNNNESAATDAPSDFIRDMVKADLDAGVNGGAVVTRFPPEPNGYLHFGHAKAICIDFGIAQQFGGSTNLRMDDTNPIKEEAEYIRAIQDDVAWLGFQWENLCFASDYFQQLYEWAKLLIEHGHAYVDDQSAEDIRKNRGTLTEPGAESPCRDRPVAENLALFEQMKIGELPDGSHVLRAKIDMASPNMVMRDPVMYRILHAEHPRTGGAWCIYPMYDWAHGQSDWIEGVTHSLCDTSFEIHRPLYEWFVQRIVECGEKKDDGTTTSYPPGVTTTPRQIEFARGNVTYLVTSKRMLLQLIEKGLVTGWDDPRMPTLRGMRRRGYLPGAIRRFWIEAGVSKRENNIQYAKFEMVLRDELNKVAQRRMAVLDPLKVVITNLPDDYEEMMDATNNPEDESAGKRQVPLSNEIYIERDDFMEDPPRKFFRLGPGREVRLRYAYWLTCTEVIKDDAGQVVELRGTIDPQTRGGDSPPPDREGKVRKVKGTLHWVSAKHAVDANVRLYQHLFTAEDPTQPPAASENWLDNVNEQSLSIVESARLEPSLARVGVGEPVQFERLGYFTLDQDSEDGTPVFNRTVTLKDTWGKKQQGGGARNAGR